MIAATGLRWPLERAGEALDALAHASGLPSRDGEHPDAPRNEPGRSAMSLTAWLERTAVRAGLELSAVRISHRDADTSLGRMGPALVHPLDAEAPGLIVLLTSRGGSARVLAPDLRIRTLPLRRAHELIAPPRASGAAESLGAVLDDAGVPPRDRGRALRALMREFEGDRHAADGWLLRLPAGASFLLQLRQSGVAARIVGLTLLHALQYTLWLAAWWMVGRGALDAHLDRGWLIAWALLLLTLVPLRMLEVWWQGRVSIEAGGLLKRRLLEGALRLEPEEVRHLGVGRHLGRVIESEAVESLALSGGLLGVLAAIELLLAIPVLALGAGGAVEVALLFVWLGAVIAMIVRYDSARRAWASRRLDLTHALVERMVGHRTRISQEAPERWHDGEDQALASYVNHSAAMDRAGATLLAVAARGWMVLALAGLAPAFVSGAASPTALAIAVGGTLLAYRAFDRLVGSAIHLSDARIAWNQVSALFAAASRPERAGSAALGDVDGDGAVGGEGRPLLEVSELSFRYQGRAEPALHGTGLSVRHGDRVLLSGPSGCGKSTLAAVLAGLREPEAGLLLLRGLDRHSWGDEAWRRRVAIVPQFHENHLLTAPLAFNLLLGRRWPASQEDLDDADGLCRRLGLGELLDCMPSGLMQVVGESGWQLSHGERSRVYVARALLQGAELLLLDESFAALDPQTLRQTLDCVVERVPSLVVIAHP